MGLLGPVAILDGLDDDNLGHWNVENVLGRSIPCRTCQVWKKYGQISSSRGLRRSHGAKIRPLGKY